MKDNTQTGSPQESKTQHNGNGWKFFFLILAVVLAAVGWFQLDSKPKILKQKNDEADWKNSTVRLIPISSRLEGKFQRSLKS